MSAGRQQGQVWVGRDSLPRQGTCLLFCKKHLYHPVGTRGGGCERCSHLWWQMRQPPSHGSGFLVCEGRSLLRSEPKVNYWIRFYLKPAILSFSVMYFNKFPLWWRQLWVGFSVTWTRNFWKNHPSMISHSPLKLPFSECGAVQAHSS